MKRLLRAADPEAQCKQHRNDRDGHYGCCDQPTTLPSPCAWRHMRRFRCGRTCSCRSCCSHRRQKPVSTSWERLDVAWYISTVVQSFAQTTNGGIQPMIKINKRIFRPELGADLFACDQLSWLLQQHRQDLKWLVLQLDANAPLAQLTGIQIGLKWAESNHSRWLGRFLHGGASLPLKTAAV